MEKTIKRLISKRENDLNYRKQVNGELIMTFKFVKRLAELKRTYFGWRGKILFPKKQSFLLKDDDNFVFWPISLLARGMYLILAAVDGKGIYVTTAYKWYSGIFFYSPEELLRPKLNSDKILTKEFLKIDPNDGIVLPEEDLDNGLKIREWQAKLDEIIAKKFFEAFLKDGLNK